MSARTLQLRTRLAIAGLVLLATTVVTGVWSVSAFRRVSRVIGETVSANERVTGATARLASTLEREDDAALLVLSDPVKGNEEIKRWRAEVDKELAGIGELETGPLGQRLRDEVDAYENAVDALEANATADDAHARYHDAVNPLLRRAVATTTEVRDQHLASSQSVAEWAGLQSTRSMQIVATISLVALALLVLVVVHFARVVMRPIGEITRAVQSIRRGDFTPRVGAQRDDEIGRLGAGVNQMADELEEFKRTNIGEVIHAKETLEATLEAFPDAVLVFGDDGKVTAANPRAREAVAADVPESMRSVVDAVLTAGTAPDATVDLAKAVELSVAGSKRRLLPRVVPIADRRGAVLVLSDVTELAKLDQMRLELVAVASHELRTPLTTMRMTLSMLQERATTYALPDRELVATAMVGIEQLSQLVDEFLDLTRIEAGQLRLQRTRLKLETVVDAAAKAIAPACEQARVSLAVEHGTNLPPSIVADQARLAMVVSNLLANAVKYTPAGGQVRVHTSAHDDKITIEVDDSGPGIAPELRERVFERFYRVERATPGAIASAGAGIGLYIARQVSEAHGGTIVCQASPLGGARFVVTIPAEAGIT
jgi:NtrC-family two-component system sensor histidine kinase KinB